MKNLKKYIDDRNRWEAIFGGTPITFPLSQKVVDNIGQSLDSDLSPENLHCDGEISYKEAIKKGNYLNDVLDDLNRYCKSNGLTEPTVYEAW